MKDGEETEDENAALYALSPYKLNESQIGDCGLLVPEDPRAIRAVEHAFRSQIDDTNEVLAIRPPELHSRMMVQLSVFTIHAGRKSIEDLEDCDEILIKYKIPYDAKTPLREELKHLGIRASNIFPDLDHLGEEIAAVRFIDPPGDKDDFPNIDLAINGSDIWNTEPSS